MPASQAPCTELHGRYRRPKQLARNAKNPGKTEVLKRRVYDAAVSKEVIPVIFSRDKIRVALPELELIQPESLSVGKTSKA